MQSLQDALRAIAQVESGNDPWFQQGTLVGSTRDKKVGRYGILASRWTQLANELGYAGAQWDDITAQDTIAALTLRELHKELDDWNLTAVAFRYGLPVARHLKDRGALTPDAIQSAGYEQVSTYVRSLGRGERMVGSVEGRATGSAPTPKPSSRRQKSEDIIRGHLYAMRNAQKKRMSVNDVNTEQPEEVVDDGLEVAG